MALRLSKLFVFGVILIFAFTTTGCGTTRKGVKPGTELKKKSKCKCKNNKGGIYSILSGKVKK